MSSVFFRLIEVFTNIGSCLITLFWGIKAICGIGVGLHEKLDEDFVVVNEAIEKGSLDGAEESWMLDWTSCRGAGCCGRYKCFGGMFCWWIGKYLTWFETTGLTTIKCCVGALEIVGGDENFIFFSAGIEKLIAPLEDILDEGKTNEDLFTVCIALSVLSEALSELEMGKDNLGFDSDSKACTADFASSLFSTFSTDTSLTVWLSCW